MFFDSWGVEILCVCVQPVQTGSGTNSKQ